MSRFVIFVRRASIAIYRRCMTELTPLIALVSVVAGATLAGVVCKLMAVRVRRVTSASAPQVSHADLGLNDSSRFGDDATLIQFSTQFCSKCPGTARLLSSEADALSGVTHIEIDLTDQIDVARRFNVLQTPTTLVLDGDGQLRARITGVPTSAVIRDELSKLGATGYRVEHTAEFASTAARTESA